VRFEDCLSAIGEADIVVSSTGAPQTILHRDGIASILPGRRDRPLFLIDIAVPRDIDADVQQLENVFLYNVDHLERLVRENLRHREHELARCETIIQERSAALLAKVAAALEPAQDQTVPAAAGWALSAAAVCQS
jgi:glutamyl-tRNA reductase